MNEKLYMILVGIFVIVIMGITYRVWTLGSDESDYTTVCIKGHTYYRANFAHKMAVSIVLDADGKPVICGK